MVRSVSLQRGVRCELDTLGRGRVRGGSVWRRQLSPLILAKGKTAIDGLSGSGSEEPTTGIVLGEVPPLIRYALIGWAIFLTC